MNTRKGKSRLNKLKKQFEKTRGKKDTIALKRSVSKGYNKAQNFKPNAFDKYKHTIKHGSFTYDGTNGITAFKRQYL